MSGRNGRTVSVRKTEAIVSYQHTKRSRSRTDMLGIEAVLFLPWFCAAALPLNLPDGGRHRKAVTKAHCLPATPATVWLFLRDAGHRSFVKVLLFFSPPCFVNPEEALGFL